jgi:hypothetical protein
MSIYVKFADVGSNATSVLKKKQELANLHLFCLDTQQGEQIGVRVRGGGKGTKTHSVPIF